MLLLTRLLAEHGPESSRLHKIIIRQFGRVAPNGASNPFVVAANSVTRCADATLKSDRLKRGVHVIWVSAVVCCGIYEYIMLI